METLTLSEASQALQVSRKSLARRAERGTIRTILDSETGKRKVPVAELNRVYGWEPNSPSEPLSQPREGQGNNGGNPSQPLDLAPVIERLEQLAAENGKLRVLCERSESLEDSERDKRIQLEAELLAARQKIEELQTSSKLWWKRRK
jgi:hypothetical protein